MKFVRWFLVVVAAVALVGTLWVGGTLGSFLLRSRVGTEVASLGAAGDIFGASNALFGSLSFLGLIVLLAIQLRDRKTDLHHRAESRQPLLVPRLGDLGIQVLECKVSSDVLRLALGLQFEVANITDEAALNARMSVRSASLSPSTTKLKNFPFSKDDVRSASFHFSLEDTSAKQFLESLAKGEAFSFSIVLTYDNLNKVTWESTSIYEASLGDPALQTIVKEAAAGHRQIKGTLGVVPSADDEVVLDLELVDDAWDHKVIARPT